MELWNYLEILRSKKKGWLFKKDNLEERVIALNRISELSYPRDIQYLIPFLIDDSKEIQNATCKLIIELFNRIENKKDYYEILKNCDILKSNIDIYQQEFTKDQFTALLAIASLNKNGYVREKAVKKLAETEDEKAIQFITYRLADWVQTVRQSALEGIENFKKTQFIYSLVKNLTIFEWLQNVERVDLSSIHSGIMNFVVVQNKKYVIENFKTFTDRTRLIIAKQLCASENILLKDLKLLLEDKHFLVRSLTLSHFHKLTQTEIDKLLNDKSSRVRIQTLYKLKNSKNFLEIVYPFLTDNSAYIREFARYSLENSISDFATIYNNNLLSKRNIIGSLSGIAETNSNQFTETIEMFLTDEKLRVRKTAFLALKKLNKEKAYNFAYKNLDTEYTGMRNLVIEFLSSTSTQEVLKKARELYLNGTFELKKSMLKLFSKIGKWATIADIMIGTIDENENIRDLSLSYLRQWKAKAATYFTEPKKDELERANQIFRFAFEIHEDNKFFKQNPLIGLDFYFR